MSRAGSNGILDGRVNAKCFLDWQKSVIDFTPFIYRGALSVSKIARESGLNRDVFYSNPEIRDVLLPNLLYRLAKDGVCKQRMANPVAVAMRDPTRSSKSDALIKQMLEDNEALKAEVNELRRQLGRLQKMDEVLHTTGRLPW